MKPNKITDISLQYIVAALLEKLPITLIDSDTNLASLKFEQSIILLEVNKDLSGIQPTLYITDNDYVLVNNHYESALRVKIEDITGNMQLNHDLSLLKVSYNNIYQPKFRIIEYRENRMQRTFDEILKQLNSSILSYELDYIGVIDPSYHLHFILNSTEKFKFKVSVEFTDNSVQLTPIFQGEKNILLEGLITNHIRNIETYLTNNEFYKLNY